MSRYNEIMQGLHEALAYVNGDQAGRAAGQRAAAFQRLAVHDAGGLRRLGDPHVADRDVCGGFGLLPFLCQGVIADAPPRPASDR